MNKKFMNCKIFYEQSMNRSCIFMNVHEQTMKVHDFMNKFSPGFYHHVISWGSQNHLPNVPVQLRICVEQLKSLDARN